VKTYRGASGSGVHVLDGGLEADSTPPEAVFQQRLAGIPGSAVLIAAAGRATLLGTVRQLVGEIWLHAGPFQYCGAVGPLRLSGPVRREIERIGNLLAAEFGLAGLFGFDFVLSGERVWTIEVNPRITASTEIVERFTGVNAVAAHVAACCRNQLPPVPASSGAAFHGKVILFAERSIELTAPLVDWAFEETHCAPWPMLADIPPAGTIVDAKRPILTAFATGADPGTVERNLRSVVASVERSMYSAREPYR
jgi:uncharacterized protein